ncbi:hypothetical protein C8R47DRAFT_1146546 [Mycena vitilis]|nr:hypothetical protein C8R47DRAFT_1146546 [Mycena vitilis]
MPIITIFGATGSQGSSVLNAVLADGKYTPRAVTRNVDSESARALRTKGVEVVQGDLFSKKSLKLAIKGSDFIFGVTNFWDPSVFPGTPNGRGEYEQGKNLVDAAKETEGTKFFVWSGLPSSKTLSNGKYEVYHIDNKADIWEYLKSSGVPCAAVDTGYFADNLWKLGALKKTDTGAYEIPIPKYNAKATQTFTWTRDIGPAVVALLHNHTEPSVAGKAFPVVTGIMTYPELASKISAAIGKEVTFKAEETSGLKELDDMYAYQADFGMFKDTEVPNPALVKLGVKLGTIDEVIATEIVPRFT